MSDNKTTSIISIDNLSKSYKGSGEFAVKNLSLRVGSGEVYGFLGPNGAGKSTTIRMLMNFIRPTSGSAKILGQDIVDDSVSIKSSVGYLSGDFALYPKMTARQYFDYMTGLQPTSDKRYAEILIKKLKANINQNMGELSRGNKQKIGLIQALMHKPKVLILDEPTTGLDPLMQEVFYDLINEARQNGAAIFISSHILGEVQKVCDRLGIIRSGKLVDEVNVHELAQKATQTFEVTFAGPVPLSELRKIKGLRINAHQDNMVNIHIQGNLNQLFAVLAKQEMIKVETKNMDIEDLFLSFYQDKESDK